MDRRTFAGACVGVLGLGMVPAVSFAQQPYRSSPLGPAERSHVLNTLGIGGVALTASRFAQTRAGDPAIREFADFEMAEQTTLAQVLGEASGIAPPRPNRADAAMLDRLQSAQGPAFEQDYVLGQIDGHRRLLAVQDRYLAEGRDPAMRHVAMLARGQVNEHLRLLDDIRSRNG